MADNQGRHPLLPGDGWRFALPRRRGWSKHELLTERIVADIESGLLAPGSRMPTHRDLAHRLGVSVQTVSLGYQDAERRGFLRGEVGRGTFVQERVTERVDRFMLDRPPNGLVDLSTVRAAYTEAHEAASRAGFAAMGAGDNSAFMRPCRPVAGLDAHREAARQWLAPLGIDAETDRIVVTNGAAHGLFLALTAIVRPGDLVLTEQLTDHGVIGLSSVLGFTLRGLPTDDEGVSPDAFAAACAAGGVRALVVTPSLTNPTSHVMGTERREAIAELARRHGVFVVEDEVYKPLLGQALPSFTGLVPELGFFATSFTKSVMTGLRIGYLVVPQRFSIRAGSILRVSGWSATNAMAELASRWVLDGTAASLVELQRAELRLRQALVAAVLGPVLASHHELSLSALLKVPRHWREDVLVRALAEKGIAATSSEPFVAGGERPAGVIRIAIGGGHSHRALRDAFQLIRSTFEQAPPVLGGDGLV